MFQIFKFFSWLCSLFRVYSINQSAIIEVDLLLALFRKRYDGFQFDIGLASVALEEQGRYFIVDFFQASASPQTFAAAINSGS